MSKKNIRLTEKELVGIIKRIIQEDSHVESKFDLSYEGRKFIVDDVVNRLLEFGDDYAEELFRLNSKFTPEKIKRLKSGSEIRPGLKISKTILP
jgi:hypothetical protein